MALPTNHPDTHHTVSARMCCCVCRVLYLGGITLRTDGIGASSACCIRHTIRAYISRRLPLVNERQGAASQSHRSTCVGSVWRVGRSRDGTPSRIYSSHPVPADGAGLNSVLCAYAARMPCMHTHRRTHYVPEIYAHGIYAHVVQARRICASFRLHAAPFAHHHIISIVYKGTREGKREIRITEQPLPPGRQRQRHDEQALCAAHNTHFTQYPHPVP